jgi:carbon-monoxide dehydrogenase catalytic subunit
VKVFKISDALGDVPILDLSVAATAPEYMEQKATIDAVLNVEKDSVKAVDGILGHIESNRKKLGI